MTMISNAETAALLLCAIPASGKQLTTAAFQKLLRSLHAGGYSDLFSLSGLNFETLVRLTGNEPLAANISERLGNRELLSDWLMRLSDLGIYVTTIYSSDYPQRVLRILGSHAPVVLFYAGNSILLNCRAISLVGSRNLHPAGKAFAEEAGKQIAAHGFTYCSGGARGADSCGYNSAIRQGSAVLFLPGSLLEEMHAGKYRDALRDDRLLLVSESGYDLHFTAARALSRNRLIHSFSEIVLIAESRAGKGGTWNGTIENLKNHWSDLYICSEDPENEGTPALIEHGCTPISREALRHLDKLSASQISIF